MKNKCHIYRLEHIVRKGEIACYKQFLTMFSAALYLWCVKMRHCVVMGELFTRRQNLDQPKFRAFADYNLTLFQTTNFRLFSS